MAKINRSALMPFSAAQMYDIVNSVEKYPEFLPWCASSKVLSQSESTMEASILMKKGKLNHSFSTRNTLTANEIIHMQLIDGPFKSLSGDWLFTQLSDQASKIELHLNFEFSNRIVSLLIGPIFTQIADSLVDAFCQRAHQIYRKQ
ncbi:MAG: type II toxin-antitoxin system RatA family toxin [Gammaproteobacteria bacterium]|jgi:ribosome-associated toxin RatA of RatAB toxin-antitoxin module|nr:type II toxin-antitoxin system RatA family toxin [Gammaproteobacteria bacterium]